MIETHCSGLGLAVDIPGSAVALDSLLASLVTNVHGDVETRDDGARASAVQAVNTSAQNQASVVDIVGKTSRYGRLNSDVLKCVALVGAQVRALNEATEGCRVAGCERVAPCYRDVGDRLDVVLGEQREVECAVRRKGGRSLDADDARRGDGESGESSREAGETHDDNCCLAV